MNKPATISVSQLLSRAGWNIIRLQRHYRTIRIRLGPATSYALARYSLAKVEAVEQSKAFQRDKKRKAKAQAWLDAHPEAAAKAKALFDQVLG